MTMSTGPRMSQVFMPRTERSPAAPTSVAAAVPKMYVADSQGTVCR